MKLRVPEGCGAVSHQGQVLEIADDGSVEVNDEAWALLATHGFRPWAEESNPDLTTMTREELVTQAMNITFEMLQGMGAEDIRARLFAAEGSILPSERDKAGAPTPLSDIDVEAISSLNRQGLFAFLRTKGVSVSLPVTNEELRAMARRSLV